MSDVDILVRDWREGADPKRPWILGLTLEEALRLVHEMAPVLWDRDSGELTPTLILGGVKQLIVAIYTQAATKHLITIDDGYSRRIGLRCDPRTREPIRWERE